MSPRKLHPYCEYRYRGSNSLEDGRRRNRHEIRCKTGRPCSCLKKNAGCGYGEGSSADNRSVIDPIGNYQALSSPSLTSGPRIVPRYGKDEGTNIPNLGEGQYVDRAYVDERFQNVQAPLSLTRWPGPVAQEPAQAGPSRPRGSGLPFAQRQNNEQEQSIVNPGQRPNSVSPVGNPIDGRSLIASLWPSRRAPAHRKGVISRAGPSLPIRERQGNGQQGLPKEPRENTVPLVQIRSLRLLPVPIVPMAGPGPSLSKPRPEVLRNETRIGSAPIAQVVEAGASSSRPRSPATANALRTKSATVAPVIVAGPSSTKSKAPAEPKTEVCEICLEEINGPAITKPCDGANDRHRFCFECIQLYILEISSQEDEHGHCVWPGCPKCRQPLREVWYNIDGERHEVCTVSVRGQEYEDVAAIFRIDALGNMPDPVVAIAVPDQRVTDISPPPSPAEAEVESVSNDPAPLELPEVDECPICLGVIVPEHLAIVKHLDGNDVDHRFCFDCIKKQILSELQREGKALCTNCRRGIKEVWHAFNNAGGHEVYPVPYEHAMAENDPFENEEVPVVPGIGAQYALNYVLGNQAAQRRRGVGGIYLQWQQPQWQF